MNEAKRIILIVLGLLGEIAAVLVFRDGDRVGGLLLHGTVSLVLSTLTGALFVFSLALAFFVPVLGLVSLIFLPFYSRERPARLSPWHLEMDESPSAAEPLAVVPDLARYLAHYRDLQPVIDTLRGEDTRAKRYSIERLASQRSPDSIQLLKKATLDEDPSVRLFASTALLHIEHELNDEVHVLRDACETNPLCADAHSALASAYYQYCYLGLLDEVSTFHYAELAVASCEKCLEIDQAQYHVWVLLGRALLWKGDCARADVCFTTAINLDPDIIDAYGWRAESLFFLGRRRELGECCRRILEVNAGDDRLREAAVWWAATEEEAA